MSFPPSIFPFPMQFGVVVPPLYLMIPNFGFPMGIQGIAHPPVSLPTNFMESPPTPSKQQSLFPDRLSVYCAKAPLIGTLSDSSKPQQPIPEPHHPRNYRQRANSFTKSQLATLEAAFQVDNYIRGSRKSELVMATGLHKVQINNWFGRRRQIGIPRDRNKCRGPNPIVQPKAHRDILEAAFLEDRYASRMRKEILSEKTGLSVVQIGRWFSERRQKESSEVMLKKIGGAGSSDEQWLQYLRPGDLDRQTGWGKRPGRASSTFSSLETDHEPLGSPVDPESSDCSEDLTSTPETVLVNFFSKHENLIDGILKAMMEESGIGVEEKTEVEDDE